MKKSSALLLAGAIVAAFGLSACGTPSSNPSSSAPSSSTGGSSDAYNINPHPYSDLKDGGELTMAVTEITEQKNYFQADGTVDTWTLWNWYNAEVIKFYPNGDLHTNPAYITDVKDEVVDGNTVVTYTLNPKAKFNDGTPIDIKAWQNTWQTNNGTNEDYNANSTDGYVRISSVEQGTDNFQVVVTFDGIYPWWGGLFNSVLHPAVNTPDLYNNAYVGTDMASAHPEWGAGPYKLDTFDATSGVVTLVRNPNWWGDPGKLDKVTLLERDTVAATNAFKNGELDVIGANTSDIMSQVKDVPGTDIRKGQRAATFMLALNSRSPELADINIRKAIMTAVDRSQVQSVLFQGMDYTEDAPGSLLLFGYQAGYQDNFSKVVPQSDLAAAKQILTDNGYTLGSDGFFADPNGAKITLNYVLFSDAASTKAVAQVFQTQLKALGIDMTIEQRPSNEFSNAIKNGDWDLMFAGFASSDPYGVAYTCQIWCSEADPQFSGLNYSHTGSAELDAQIHAMEQLPTADEQIAAANTLEVTAFQNYGLEPVYSGPMIYVVKSGLANVGSAGFAGNSSSMGDFKENIGWVA